MCSRSATAGTHRAESVRIVHQQTEAEFLFEGHYLVELAEVSLHSEHAFGDYQNAAAILLGHLGGMFELFAQRSHVVVSEYETFAAVQTHTVDDAGVRLGIVYHHVARSEQTVDNRNHALITEVEQERILLADECSQLTFELFVIFCLTAHHAGAHRGCHSEICGAFGIGLAHFGMIGQTQIVVEAPIQHRFAAESHVRTDGAFEFGEREISVAVFLVHTDRAAGILFESV